MAFLQSWLNVRKKYNAKKQLMLNFRKKNTGLLGVEIIFHLLSLCLCKIFSLKIGELV